MHGRIHSLYDESLPVTTAGVISHLALVRNLHESTASQIGGPLWTIAVECQIYLLFPSLVATRRKFGMQAVMFGTFFVSIVLFGTGCGDSLQGSLAPPPLRIRNGDVCRGAFYRSAQTISHLGGLDDCSAHRLHVPKSGPANRTDNGLDGGTCSGNPINRLRATATECNRSHNEFALSGWFRRVLV